MTSGDSLFLDTSIQISRRGLPGSTIDDIEAVLRNYNFISTSSFVRFEFRQSLLQDLVYLHRALFDEKCLSKAFERFSKLSPFHQRKLTIILTQFASFFADLNQSGKVNDEILAEKAMYYFENLIEELWEWFEESVDHISDGTQCVRSRMGPEKPKQTFELKLKISRRSRCELYKFLQQNETHFKKIMETIDRLAPSEDMKIEELKRISAAIKKGLSDPNFVCDGFLCRSIGDALVAVEALNFKELFTKDSDQALVISPIIGLKAHLLN